MKAFASLILLAGLGFTGEALAHKCYNDAAQSPRCYDTMADLLRNNRVEKGVSKEMLMCIMWEETAFCNIENTGSKAVGFGQLILGGQGNVFWKELEAQGKTGVSNRTILDDDDLSVFVSATLLKVALDWKRGNVDGALEAYAGAPNKHVVPNWKECEKLLTQGAIFLTPNEKIDDSDRAVIKKALDAANRHRAPANRVSPDVIFDADECQSGAYE
jgi:hypothetical protein